jgi:hypothetical protein
VGEPGLAESFIFVWGPGRAAVNDFQQGNYVWGTINTGLAISDLIPMKAAAGAVCRGTWRLSGPVRRWAMGGLWKFGSNTWKATRPWLGRIKAAMPGEPVHHWCIPQGGWAKDLPDRLKNQPWNLMNAFNKTWHDWIEGKAAGGKKGFRLPARLWFGTPPWFRAGLISCYGRAANAWRDILGGADE